MGTHRPHRVLNKVEVLDTTSKQFSQIVTMQKQRCSFTAEFADGKIHCFGNRDSCISTERLNTNESYNFDLLDWKEDEDVPVERCSFDAVTIYNLRALC